MGEFRACWVLASFEPMLRWRRVMTLLTIVCLLRMSRHAILRRERRRAAKVRSDALGSRGISSHESGA